MNTNVGECIVVEIDEELISIVPEYLENRLVDCQVIEQLLSAGTFTEISSLAHRMKGSGGSYGFEQISDIGEMLEEAALACNADVIEHAVKQLRSYLARVTVEYV